MYSKSRKESNVQVDDDETDSSYNFLLKTESILNTFNKIFGRIFSCPISSKDEEYCETIRSSRKSFKLNDPEAFNEDLTQHRPFVPAKAILLPLCNKTSHINKKFIIKEDEEEELFCVLHADGTNEEIVRVYTSDSTGRQEIMKLYVDNEPPKRIVRKNESIWKFIPLKTFQKKARIRTHFTGDGCKLRDPLALEKKILASGMASTVATEESKRVVYDQESQCTTDETCFKRGRKKKLRIPIEFF